MNMNIAIFLSQKNFEEICWEELENEKIRKSLRDSQSRT